MSESLRARDDAILEERARALAARTQTVEVDRGQTMAVLRYAEGSLLALPATAIMEVVRLSEVVRLPGMPTWLPGVTLHRGEPICLVDVGLLLGLRATEDAAVLVVVQSRPGVVGVLADKLVGLRDIPLAERSEDLSPAAAEAGFVAFVTSDLITVIDPDRLTRDPRVAGEAETQKEP